MWWLRARLLHALSVLRSARTEREVDEEIRFHLDMRTRENVEAGLSPEEARREAARRFGPVSRVNEAACELRRGTALNGLAHDARQAARALGRAPGFAALVAVTTALGIGANTAIFSVVEAALLRPLPYERPEELALVWSSFQKMGASRAPAAGAELRALRERGAPFRDVAGIWVGTGTLTGDGEPEQIKVANVTPNFFATLGASPSLGRAFPADAAPGLAEVVLTDGLWRRRFGGDPGVVGSVVRFGQQGFTVAGVMPADFRLAFPADANVPADVGAFMPFRRDVEQGPADLYYLRLLARLEPGATVEQAQAAADAVAERLRADVAAYEAENLRLEVAPLHGDAVRDIRPALLVLFAGAAVVLVISCFNVANLLLTRANVRRREIAVRLALGGSRARVARQLLVESLLLGALGGALGLAVAWGGVVLLSRLRPESLARVGPVELDLTGAAFLAVVSAAVGLAAGLAPMAEARKVGLVDTLKEESRTFAGAARSRLRSALVVGEIALGFVLLVGAGLMLRTLVQLHRVSPGFDPEGVLTFELAPPGESAAERAEFVARWEERLASLPGVTGVGAVSHLPLGDYPNWYSPYRPEGVTEEAGANLLADYRAVTPGYFRSIGARLAEGRDFERADGASGRGVVIVDDVLARQTWPDGSAVGRLLEVERFTDEGFVGGTAEVVGVVEHVKSQSLFRPVRGQIYIPYGQSAREHLSFAVRTTGDPAALAPAVRAELRALDKTRAVAKVRPMGDYVEKAMAATSFTALLASVFAVVALVLAAVGIYGVVAYSMSQRTREMGLRVALGARPSDILRLVLGEGFALAAAGLALGFVASLAASGFVRGLLFNVTPLDPVTLATMTSVTALATLAACWRPARKAASGRLADALRE
jgi:predicted permease